MAANTERRIERDLALLQQRAVAVAAFKSRVQVEGMTRPSRSPVEQAFFEAIGATMPFCESGAPFRDR